MGWKPFSTALSNPGQMTTRQTLLVDAFTREPMTGNVAGVVPDAEGLSERQMGAIAGELGASETAFVLPSDEADRRLRYFTPEQEVPLCGHATVATHAALFERGTLDVGEYTYETEAGTFGIELEDDGTVWMEQDDAAFDPVDVSHEEMASALGVDVATLRDVGADFPMTRATTGLAYLFVPINYLEHLSGMDPNMNAIAEISEAEDVAGVYAFTFDTLDGESTVHARSFAPAAGVPEDPVTGTAGGACGALLRHHGAIDEEIHPVVVEQGHFLDRPGRLRVATDGEAVRIGGTAVTTLVGDLVVPEIEDDDIVEA